MLHSKIKKVGFIEQDIINGYYNYPYNEYPDKPRKPSGNVNSVEEAESLVQKMKVYENEMKVYQEKLDKHRNDINFLRKEFHIDLSKNFGVENHPKEDILYNIAWEHGHSDGLMHVYEWYMELSELLI